MQPTFKPRELDRYTYRPQPLEPIRRSKPWVVPIALAFLIVFLLVALVALAQQAPTSPEPLIQPTTTIFDITR